MSTHSSDMSMGGFPQVAWRTGEPEVNKMSSPWGDPETETLHSVPKHRYRETHGIHTLTPFQVHAGVQFGDQEAKRGEEG